MSNLLSDLSNLLSIGVLKVGSFQLKSGNVSPFYIDLRRVMSHPAIFNSMVDAIHAKKQEQAINADVVCGVPYTSVPIAAAYMSRFEIPLIMRRKEAKGYGTNKQVEGVFQKGQTCLVVEDTVVSGTSILETALDLRKVGLVVSDCICVLDRTQGGKANLKKHGITLHSVFDFEDMFSLYCSINTVGDDLKFTVKKYLDENVCSIDNDADTTPCSNGPS
ncbi:hypothetical protein JTE90_020995 [Oedothorax gibbosus]|uniref:orotate phosphoribosyltransferase n=1 Tax=Oedothorax gibbosus TaxID=931172 RepID=A0AAV6TYS9_9ARAC|nr:hypothetical protein JTE90_020995 [Oedothorax gibbosus]